MAGRKERRQYAVDGTVITDPSQQFWIPEMDAALRQMRAAGEPLVICAERIGVAYPTALRRATRFNLNARMNNGRHSAKYVLARTFRAAP